MGTEFFNSNDIEHWNNVRATNATGGYEALSVIFDYSDRVREVIDMRL